MERDYVLAKAFRLPWKKVPRKTFGREVGDRLAARRAGTPGAQVARRTSGAAEPRYTTDTAALARRWDEIPAAQRAADQAASIRRISRERF